MPDTYTPNLNLTLVEVGASRDTWGTKLNANTTTIDQMLAMAMPIGSLLDFAGPNPPSGWLIADGRAVSRTTYSALFAAIGTYWGQGDGATTFALPDPIGRSSVGPGNMVDQNGQGYSFSFAQMIGSVQYQIYQQHLPNYAIGTDAQGWHSHGGATAPGGNHLHYTDAQGSHSHGGGTSYELQAHTHSGSTDTQGSHSHTVYTPYGYGGGGGGAAYTVQNIGGYGAYTDTQGSHAHNYTTGNENQNHSHTIYADGVHSHNISYSGNLQLGIYGDGTHTHTIYLGGSSAWFPVLNPVIVVTKIIYAGTQAATAMAAAAAATTTVLRADESDELALIREELAALRAILAPPGRPQHLMRAPMRGVH